MDCIKVIDILIFTTLFMEFFSTESSFLKDISVCSNGMLINSVLLFLVFTPWHYLTLTLSLLPPWDKKNLAILHLYLIIVENFFLFFLQF